MGWIESHTSLSRNRKLKRLMRSLHVDVPTALGYLHLLWYYAADFAPDGVLDTTEHTPGDIADGCFWEGDPQEFLKALTDAKFLDPINPQSYQIHDWEEYNRQYRQRKYWAEQKRKQRAEEGACPQDVPGTSSGRPQDSDRQTDRQTDRQNPALLLKILRRGAAPRRPHHRFKNHSDRGRSRSMRTYQT